MFERLKKEISLQESKEFSANALKTILSEASMDDEIEELMGLEEEDKDDVAIESLIDKIPEDNNSVDIDDEDDEDDEEISEDDLLEDI